MKISKILSVSLICALVTACGLKGGLYKEDKKSERAGDFNRVEASTPR